MLMGSDFDSDPQTRAAQMNALLQLSNAPTPQAQEHQAITPSVPQSNFGQTMQLDPGRAMSALNLANAQNQKAQISQIQVQQQQLGLMNDQEDQKRAKDAQIVAANQQQQWNKLMGSI